MVHVRRLRESNQYILLVAVALIVIILYARDLLGVGIGKFIILAVTILPALFMRRESIIYYFFFLLPLASGLPANYIWPIILILLIYKRPENLTSKGMICFFTIFLFELIHYAFYDFHIDVSNLVGYLSTIFLFCYIATLKDPVVKNKKCILFFVFGIFIYFIAIWYITQVNHNADILLEEGGRIGYTKQLTESEENRMMLNANPNGLGYFSLIGLSLVLVLYALHKLRDWTFLLFSFVFVYVGALSVSRTWLLGMFFLILMLIFFTRDRTVLKNDFRIFSLLLVMAVGIYSLIRNETIYQAFIDRFSSESVATAGGRISIFQEYNKFFYNNPLYLLFGVGAVHYHDVISEIIHATHNGTQQIVASYGLVGLFAIIIMVVKSYKINYRRGFFICAIPFFVALFYVQSGQLLNPHQNLYPMIISFVAMRLIDDDRFAQLK